LRGEKNLLKDTFWIDLVRVIATFSVVLWHVSAAIVKEFGKIEYNNWLVGNFYDSFARFCVPVFFMISGGLFLSRDIVTKTFLIKRFYKIIPPLIFWSVIYIIYSIFIRIFYHNEEITFFKAIKISVSLLLSGSSYHLWFVYAICGLYLFVPIIQKWIKYSSKNEIILFLLLWLFSNLFQINKILHYLPMIDLTNFSGYLGYFVLGYYLINSNSKKLESVSLNIFFVIFGISTTFILTTYFSLKNQTFDGLFYGYLMPNTVISAIGVFQIVKRFKVRNVNLRKVILRISSYSFAIYFIHVLILNIFQQFNISGMSFLPIIGIPIISVIVFFLSYYIILILRKVAILNKLLG